MAKRKSEWGHLRGKTEVTVGDKTYTLAVRAEDPQHADIVAAARELWKDKPFEEQLAAWNAFEAEKDRLQKEIATINANITALERLAFAYMEAKDFEDLTVGGGRFVRELSVSAKTVDKAAVLKWFQEHMPEMVSVHYQTLQSQTKDAFRAGRDLPDGVEIEPWDYIKRTNA